MLIDTTAKTSELLAASFRADRCPPLWTHSSSTPAIGSSHRHGAAQFFGPSLGKFQPNLAAPGYRPEQVDMVLITHTHPDHIAGLVTAGKMSFPNATVHADQRDADFWLAANEVQQVPAARKAFFQDESEGQRLVAWGGLPNIASVKFAEPTVSMTFDSDAPRSEREHAKGYANAAQERYLVPGVPLPFPGSGHVRGEQVGYTCVPLDYMAAPDTRRAFTP